MFHAIEKSKVGNQSIKFKREDFLTAAVFGRLIYLPSNLLWDIIKSYSFNSEHLPKHSGYLKNYEFWPKWETPQLSSNYREPDVFLQFKEIDVIVEAKLGDKENLQSPKQWAEELIARMNQEDQEDYDPTKPILFLAIGGFGNNIDKNQFLEKRKECYKIISNEISHYEHIFITGLTWQSLLRELKRVLNYLSQEQRLQKEFKTTFLKRHSLYRLIRDIVNILAFYGIKDWKYFGKVIKHIPNYQIRQKSFDLFSKTISNI